MMKTGRAGGPAFDLEYVGAPSFGVRRAGLFVGVNLTGQRDSNQDPHLKNVKDGYPPRYRNSMSTFSSNGIISR